MGFPRPAPDKTLTIPVGSSFSFLTGNSDSAEPYFDSSSLTKCNGVLTLGFGCFLEESDSSCDGGEGYLVGIKPRPRPRGGALESLFKKEENEGITGEDGSSLPLPRPWPCGSGDASSCLEFSGSFSVGLSTVNWKGAARPRPLPPPPPDEVEKAAEMEEAVAVARPITGYGIFVKLLRILGFRTK